MPLTILPFKRCAKTWVQTFPASLPPALFKAACFLAPEDLPSQQYHANGDSAIRDIKYRPDAKIQEINNMPEREAVDEIPYGPGEHKR
jgi:hypothetical protein